MPHRFFIGRTRTRPVAALASCLALAAALAPPAAAQVDPVPRLKAVGRDLLYGDTPVRLFGQGDEVLLIKSKADEIAETLWYEPFDANFTRIHAFGPFIPDSEEPLQPWPKVDGVRVDLRRKNAAYYERLAGYLNENRRLGRVVLLQVFDEVGFERGADRWDLNPFQPDRNVNSLGLPPAGRDGLPEFFTLANAALREVQEDYVRNLVLETHRFGNVIYEICNEYSGSVEWLDHFVRFFQSLEAETGRDLVVTNMSCNAGLLAYEVASPAIDVLDVFHAPESLRQYTTRQIHDRFLAARAYGKPVIAGRIGPEPDISDLAFAGVRRSRSAFWSIFMAGGVGSTTKEDDDGIRTRFGPPLYCDDPEWELSIKALQSFIADAGDVRGYVPDDGLVESAPTNVAFALRAPLRILVYLAEPVVAGDLRLRGLDDGAYTVRVFDPVSGAYAAVSRAVVSGGRVTVPVPAFSEDIAFVLDASPITVTVLRSLVPEPDASRIEVVVLRHAGIDPGGDGRADYTGTLAVDGRPVPLERDVAVDVVRKARVERLRFLLPKFAPGAHEIAFRVVDAAGERDATRHRFFVRD